jgi:hypothetical protein
MSWYDAIELTTGRGIVAIAILSRFDIINGIPTPLTCTALLWASLGYLSPSFTGGLDGPHFNCKALLGSARCKGLQIVV